MSIPQQGGGPIERYEQLAEYLAEGCKPKDDWRIGTEHEKFGYCKDTLLPLPYDGPRSIKAMLEGLRDRYGWDPIEEQGHIIGLVKDGANVSLEPGGQLELSGAPLATIHQTCDEVNEHLREVHTIADEIGAGFIGLGAAPIWSHEQMPMMPKGRYRLMTDYMGRVGSHGTQMMYRTCTVQVNLDFASEADMVQKFRVALALQPVATALFANSPFFDGKVNGFKSWRSRIWRDLDAARTGMLPFAFEDGMGFEAYVDYALSVPMYFVQRGARYIDARRGSFADFMEGRLEVLPGERPTDTDWLNHLSTLFPDARLKSYLEMRGADGGPWRRLCALPAFWTGLLYDGSALDAAWDLVKDWSSEEREKMRNDVPRLGLAARLRSDTVQDIAKQAVSIAREGLARRARTNASGEDESIFLEEVESIVWSGKTPAERLLERFHGEWEGKIDPLFAAEAY